MDGAGGKRVVWEGGMLQAETSTEAAPAHIFVRMRLFLTAAASLLTLACSDRALTEPGRPKLRILPGAGAG